MFLEMINDVFMSSSIFYFYFGMFIMTIGVSKLLVLQHNIWKTDANIHLYDSQSIDLAVFKYERPLMSHQRFIIWFIRSCKRLDQPDDDGEDPSISYFKNKRRTIMGENNILTAFKKYGAVVLAISILVLLTGCGDFSPVDESSTGLFTEYIVYPFSLLIKAIARVFNGSYGLSIIVITIGIRLIILPFMLKQQKQSKLSQEKMKLIKPEMDEIQKKYKDKRDMDDQLAMQRELNELYQKHNFNPVKMVSGCLPMIIQMPFLIGFYYAIRRTSEIGEQPFLWFNLGETDLILVGLAVAIYFLQARVSLIGLEQKQQGAMGMMVYISPIMIGIVSLSMPAALPLYWAIGGLFMVIQTLIIKKYVLE